MQKNLFYIFIFFLSACSSYPPFTEQKDPKELLTILQNIGAPQNRQSTARFQWTQNTKKSLFTAYITATPQKTSIEITSFFNTTLSFIQIEEKKVTIQQNQKTETALNAQWKGIPNALALLLFLGKIPLPASIEKMTTTKDAQLILTALDQTYTYHFRYIAPETPWPDQLLIQSKTKNITLTFNQPENKFLSPQSWSLQSSNGTLTAQIIYSD